MTATNMCQISVVSGVVPAHTKDMDRAMARLLAWEVVKARQIF